MPVLYLAQLDIPLALLLWIGTYNPSLSRRLHATKIGCSGSVAECHAKMKRMQTQIGFATLKYTMIVHDHDDYQEVERAIHFVARPHQIAGEWYDLDISWKNMLITRFQSNCQISIIHGTTHFPTLQLYNANTDMPGWVYMARYNWTGDDLVILTLLEAILQSFPQGHSWKAIVTRMFSTKIGSTEHLNPRLSQYIWAQCAADIRYVAFHHPTMRAEEQRLHNTRQNLWIGNGEWFNLSIQDKNSIEQEYINMGCVRTVGVYVRTQNLGNTGVTWLRVFRWIFELGLVTLNDVYNNALHGVMPMVHQNNP